MWMLYDNETDKNIVDALGARGDDKNRQHLVQFEDGSKEWISVYRVSQREVPGKEILTAADICRAVDIHNSLREAAYNYMRKNPGCLGHDAWLRHAICENDITITTSITGELISATGICYSMQTMNNESFSFSVELKDLDFGDDYKINS